MSTLVFWIWKVRFYIEYVYEECRENKKKKIFLLSIFIFRHKLIPDWANNLVWRVDCHLNPHDSECVNNMFCHLFVPTRSPDSSVV
jgi:hypothetical protein